jgi:hypothetical protein
MQIFIARNNQQLGPYDLETIKTSLQNGSISPNDLAWYEGAAGWAPLSTVPGVSATPPPVPPAPPPPPPVPQAAPAPAVSSPSSVPVQPEKKSSLKVVGSVLAGIIVISVGVLKIVRVTRLFANQSSTQTVPATTTVATTPVATSKLLAQNTVAPSMAPQPAAQLKTISFPTENPQIRFEISKDATPKLVKNGTACFTYDFLVCVSASLEQKITFEENEIKEAEGELTKQLTTAMTNVLQKEHGATGVHVNKTGHFKTAKGALIFYTEATYKNAKGADMICLNHVLASNKGMFIFQGYAQQKEKDAFYAEMRRLLDSVAL